MRPIVKVGLVVAGYVIAFAITSAVIAIYVTATNGPDRQSSGGMSAFGDSLLFLAMFGVAAVPATCAALYFLRPYRLFWLVLSVAAFCTAITGLAALIDYIASLTADAASLFHTWSALALLRILVAPLLVLVFLLSGLFAPQRSYRIALLVATASEVAVFTFLAFIWLYSYQSH